MQPSYRNIHEIPKGWRYLRGYPLSFEQAKSIIAGAVNREAESNGAKSFPVCLREARENFMGNHHTDEPTGSWVPN